MISSVNYHLGLRAQFTSRREMAATLGEMLLAALLVAVVLPASTAKDYTVGESSGWTAGVDYSAWTEGKTFHVDDTLSFQYNPVHSVMEVSAADHGACSTSNPLRWYTDQSTTIQLTEPGTRYFICGTSGHCTFGMKLAVTVSDSLRNSAPATSTSTAQLAKPSKSTGNDDATSAAATTATTGSSSKLTSNTSSDADGGARITTVLLLVTMGLPRLVW